MDSLSPGKVTLRSLAQELLLAPATVLRALNNHPNVTVETRRRVIRLARLRNYQLPTHAPKFVAVILPSYSFHGYTGLLINALMNELRNQGLQGEIITINQLEILQEHVYAGAISLVWYSNLEKSWPEQFNLPLIVINAPGNPREGVYQVTSDERQGFYLALNYLYARQKRHIALITPPGERASNTAIRQEIFRAFCREHDILNCSVIREHNRDITLGKIIPELLDMQIEAIFSTSESTSLEIVSLIHQHQRKIPEDIAFMAMENECITPFTEPPLTALAQDFNQLATQSVHLLLQRIAGQVVPDSIAVPYQLIERASC